MSGRICPSDISHGIFKETPQYYLFNRSLHLTPSWGLEVQKLSQALMSVKGLDNTCDLDPRWARTVPSEIFIGILKETLPQFCEEFNWSWYLAPCCGLQVQKPNQTLRPVNDTGSTFYLNPKRARTLSSGIVHGLFKKNTPNNLCNRSWYLTHCCGLEVPKPTQTLK